MTEQLQPDDTLIDRGVDDVLDEGYSPPEHWQGVNAKGTTAAEESAGETLEERMRQEEPDVGDSEDRAEREGREDQMEDDPYDSEVGNQRSGRLVAPDEGFGEDTESELIARDVGISGGAAGAEEAAMHEVDEP